MNIRPATTLILLISIFFVACKKSDPVITGKKYSDAKGTYIAIDSTRWYLTTMGNGGEVHFKVSGSTNADKLVIASYGDGVNMDNNITTDSNRQFIEDAIMSFSVTARQTDTFQENAILTAYKGTDTLKVTLASESLHY